MYKITTFVALTASLLALQSCNEQTVPPSSTTNVDRNAVPNNPAPQNPNDVDPENRPVPPSSR